MSIRDLLEARNQISMKIDTLNEMIGKHKDHRDQVEKEIADKMVKEGIEKVSGEGITAWIKQEISPKVDSWDEVYAYIHKNNRYDLLNKTIKKSTFKEMVDAGTLIPGTSINTFDKISFRKN